VGQSNDALPFGAVAGGDFLFQADVEISLASRELKFFRPVGCADAFLAYWDAGASVVPFESSSSRDVLPAFEVSVNGQKTRAIIDSGSSRTIVDLRAAERAGVSPRSTGVIPAGTASGVGRHDMVAWIAPFDTLSIGAETLSGPRLRIADLWAALLSDVTSPSVHAWIRDQPAVLLGLDFLDAHRVLIAKSQRKLYFSYVGSPAPAARP
jgi:hypothetical protein